MKKRLLTIVLTIAMLFQMTVSYAGAWDYIMEENLYEHGVEESKGEIYYVAGTNNINKNIKFSMDMGLITTYIPEATITKGDLKKALNLIFKIDYIYNDYFKNDKEEEILTVDEATVVFMDAAGYGTYFELNGDTSLAAYQLEAVKQGLFEDVDYDSAKQKLTAESFYNMFYNLLNMDAFTIKKIGDPKGMTYTFSKTPLMVTDLKLTFVEGVVRANSYTSLNGSPAAGDDRLVIEGISYKSDKIKDADTFLGYKVDAYVDKDGNICSIAVDDESNTMEYFNDKTNYEPSGNKLIYKYYDENGKEKKVKLSTNADVIYNHVTYPGFDETIFDLKNGYIQFIDNNGDNLYDVAFIYEYTSFMPTAKYSSNYTVKDKLGNTYDLSRIINDEVYKGIFSSVGESAEFDDITMRKGISLLTLKDFPSIVTEAIILEENTYEGKYTEHKSDDKSPYIIGEKSFAISVSFAQANQNFSGSEFPFELGDRMLVYLDQRGKIINAVQIDKRLKYGYVREIFTDRPGSKNVYIEIFTQDSQMLTFKLAEKLKYKGNNIYAKNFMDGTTARELFKSNKTQRQIIQYMLGVGGEIKEIKVASEANKGLGAYNNSNGFELNYDGSLPYHTGSLNAFGAKYRLDKTKTIIFQVPADDREEYYRISADDIVTEVKYLVKFYDVDENYVPGVLVLMRSKLESTIWQGSTWTRSGVVVKTGKRYDATRDMDVDFITYRDTIERSVFINLEVCVMDTYTTPTGGRFNSVLSYKDIKPGDIVEVKNDYAGLCTSFCRKLTLDFASPLKDQVFEIKIDGGLSDNENKGIGLSETSYYSGEITTFAKVVKKHSEGIMINADKTSDFTDFKWNRALNIGETTLVHCYNIGRDIFEQLTLADVQEGDFIFVEMHKGTVTTVVIYRP